MEDGTSALCLAGNVRVSMRHQERCRAHSCRLQERDPAGERCLGALSRGGLDLFRGKKVAHEEKRAQD